MDAIIDWEFSCTRREFGDTSSIWKELMQPKAAFDRHFSPVTQMIGMATKQRIPPELCKNSPELGHIPDIFESHIQNTAPDVYAEYKVERDAMAVLGEKGLALKNIREYLRACLEVCIRQENKKIPLAEGSWKSVVTASLEILSDF